MQNVSSKTLDNVIATLQAHLPTYKTDFETENPDQNLPEITLYKKGFHDIFNLWDYPAIVVSLDNRSGIGDGFSNLKLDVVLIISGTDAEILTEIGTRYADVIQNLLIDHYRLDDTVVNTEIEKVDHFGGTDKYIVDFTLNIEREI